MTKVAIPSGLFDSNLEFFSHENKPMAFFNGKMQCFFDLPQEFQELVWKELQEDEAAFLALKYSGFKSKREKLEKYTVCRFGGLDTTPDIVNGHLVDCEYFDCGFRGNCAMEGIVCRSIVYRGSVLTPRDMQMIRHLSSEDTIPVIAEKMQMCINSFENHKKELFSKLGVLSRASLVALAFIHNLLKPSLCIT
jgi:DNA-binding CsgD family transcriptional regulator